MSSTDVNVRRGGNAGPWRLAVLVTCLLAAGSAAAYAQPPAPAPAAAGVVLEAAGRSERLSVAALQALDAVDVEFLDHGAPAGTYRGVRLRTLLDRLGAPAGAELRGAGLRQAVVVRAADGYAVVFSAGELDAGFGKLDPVLAWSHDGAALDTYEGPLRLIVPGDARPARSVRQVIAISIVDAAR